VTRRNHNFSIPESKKIFPVVSYEGIHTHPTPSIVPSANRDNHRTIPSHITHNRASKPTLSYSLFVISHRHHKPESSSNSSFRTESKTSLDRIHALGLALHDILRPPKWNAKTPSTHSRGSRILCGIVALFLPRTHLLNLILALPAFAVWN
jgi:hypothetical protein